MGLLGILWAIVVILVLFWVVGLVAHLAGGFIHLLLIAAVILIVYNLITHSRSRRTL